LTVAFGEVNEGDGQYKNGFGGLLTTHRLAVRRLMTVTITGVGARSRSTTSTNSADFTSFGTVLRERLRQHLQAHRPRWRFD
jgi:hypothetical protein